MIGPNAVRASGPPLIGILGGMGPAATVDFYAKLTAATSAKSDQEHVPVVIWADPTVPDRVAALVNGQEDPTPWLVYGAQMLAKCGADLIVMPCNTAHAFLPGLESAVDTPIISMIEAAVDCLADVTPSPLKVGLLATDGTLQTRLYQSQLSRSGIACITPRNNSQQFLMEALKSIKAGDVGADVEDCLTQVALGLVEDGAEVIIAGCTEILISLRPESVPVPVIDPARELAHKAIQIWRLSA